MLEGKVIVSFAGNLLAVTPEQARALFDIALTSQKIDYGWPDHKMVHYIMAPGLDFAIKDSPAEIITHAEYEALREAVKQREEAQKEADAAAAQAEEPAKVSTFTLPMPNSQSESKDAFI